MLKTIAMRSIRTLRALGVTLLLSALPSTWLSTFGASHALADANDEAAHQHFAAGVRLLQDPDGARFEDAYREFRAAYAASPNPKILGNIGYCAMKLERDGEAIAAYSRYLAEAPDVDADEREQITRDLSTMRTGLVKITVAVEQGVGEVTVIDTRTPINGAPIVNAYGPTKGMMEIDVRPGRHVLRARDENGNESVAWEIEPGSGSKQTHTFVVLKAEPKPKLSSEPARPMVEPKRSLTVPWIVTSVGGALLIAGATTGLVVMNKVGKLDARCPNDACPAGSGLDAERESTKRWMRATDVLLASGAVLATTGVVWLLIAKPSSSESAPRPTALLQPPAVSCSGVGCSVSLVGRF